MKFIDIHTHSVRSSGHLQIVDCSGGIIGETEKENYFSFGIHPWFLNADSFDEQLKDVERYCTDSRLLAIGECGLDKETNTDFLVQLEIFQKQILLSEKYRKPLIIHIVKAFNELILLRKEMKAAQVWIVHGFNGSLQLAKQLTDIGIFVSFGFRLSDPFSKASKNICDIPIRQIFLETDDSKMTIEDIYFLASQRLNLNEKQLQKQLMRNFKTVFL